MDAENRTPWTRERCPCDKDTHPIMLTDAELAMATRLIDACRAHGRDAFVAQRPPHGIWHNPADIHTHLGGPDDVHLVVLRLVGARFSFDGGVGYLCDGRTPDITVRHALPASGDVAADLRELITKYTTGVCTGHLNPGLQQDLFSELRALVAAGG